MTELNQHTGTTSGAAKSHRGLLILNLVILAALAILYILYFSSGNKGKEDAALKAASGKNLRIAFINNDSITEHYELVKLAKEDLEAQRLKYEGDISARKGDLESQYKILQGNIEAKRFPESQLRNAQQLLMQKEQDLYDLSQEYSNQLANEEIGKNQVYIDSVLNFLERFNKNYHFDYILNYSAGANILIANDTFDITPQVIKGLNEEWLNATTTEKK